MKPEIVFKEITADNLRDVIKLSDTLQENQKKAVATNAVSIAQAHYSKNAWFRAIYHDSEPVGFIMLDYSPIEKYKDTKHAFLWRFMIGGNHQKKGYGKAALELLVEKLRNEKCEKLVTSANEEFGPLEFYKKAGFVDTGEYIDVHERVFILDLLK
ncbi:MAG: GNAT family N-acetyltransferase [Kosmotoga sp.]|jgi:diamine N-acetyltransferase|nr:MAG: GNAT family N-acetyltransferase [Kosmotoga sp.]